MESKMFAKFFLFSRRRVLMNEMDRTIFIFIDGCGVGRADAGNPFFQAATRCRLSPGASMVPICAKA